MPSLIGCSSNFEPDDPPDVTIQRAVSAIKKADFNELSKELDPQNYSHNEVEWSEALGFVGNELGEIISGSLIDYVIYAADKLEYEIVKIDIEDNRAVAIIRFTYLDCKPYFEDSLSQLAIYLIGVSSRGATVSLEVYFKRYSDILKDNIGKHEKQYVEETIEIPMIVRKNKWYIEELTDDLINITGMGIIKVNQQLEQEGYINKKIDELSNSGK